MADTFDLIVIGSGPGGYVAAIKAAQLGFKTACVERDALGGTCLNIGCIPSKAMLHCSQQYHEIKHRVGRHGIKVGEVSLDMPAMLAFKDDVVKKMSAGVGYLLKKNNVTSLKGHGRILSPGAVQVANGTASTVYEAAHILIATGSAPIQIPALQFDGQHILSSTEALALKEVPKKMIVVGGGYIGVELGSVWSRLGSEVLVVEFTAGILPPSDREMANALQRLLEKQGIKFKFNTSAQGAEMAGGKVRLAWKNGEATGVEEVDKVLVSVGRRPVTDNLGAVEVGVAIDAKGFIKVNDNFQTSVPGIYAIGDVIGGIMLAHKAEEEAVAAVEIMAGQPAFVNYAACPAVVFTHPELAAVGLTEEEAVKRGPIKIGKCNFAANGRARGIDETDGFVKVIGDAKTDRLLGVHILGAGASDMIAEAAVAMEFAASVDDVARSFHAHPTLPEALKEAALAANKRAVNI